MVSVGIQCYGIQVLEDNIQVQEREARDRLSGTDVSLSFFQAFYNAYLKFNFQVWHRSKVDAVQHRRDVKRKSFNLWFCQAVHVLFSWMSVPPFWIISKPLSCTEYVFGLHQSHSAVQSMFSDYIKPIQLCRIGFLMTSKPFRCAEWDFWRPPPFLPGQNPGCKHLKQPFRL